MDIHSPTAALVIGARGGIGAALADALDADPRYAMVHRASRHGTLKVDITDPVSIAAMMAVISDGPPVTTAIIATGLLHNAQHGPEKSLREIDRAWLVEQFTINMIGPALVLAQLLPHLPRDRPAYVAALGARVGSISDNRRGGWYGYRSAKAALHQFIRTASIEWQRTHPMGTLVALHPGTVATPLSAPFQRGVPVDQLQSPQDAATRLAAVLHGLDPSHSGRIFDHHGAEIAP